MSETILEEFKSLLSLKQEGNNKNYERVCNYNKDDAELCKQITALKKRRKEIEEQKKKEDIMWDEWFRVNNANIEAKKVQYSQMLAVEGSEKLEQLKIATGLYNKELPK